MTEPSPPQLVVVDEPHSLASEAFRGLRTNLHYASPDAALRRVLVTSAGPGEGKSTTLANLAAALAQAERSVLVVDSDLRRPILHTLFDRSATVGLSSYLVGETAFDDVVLKTPIPGLSLVPSGPIPPNPAELLASARMREFLRVAGEGYDVVLLDSPPLLAVTDACALAALVDGVLLVLASGQTPEAALRRAKEQVEAARGRVVGVVMNRFGAESDGYYQLPYYREYTRDGEEARSAN